MDYYASYKNSKTHPLVVEARNSVFAIFIDFEAETTGKILKIHHSF